MEYLNIFSFVLLHLYRLMTTACNCEERDGGWSREVPIGANTLNLMSYD